MKKLFLIALVIALSGCASTINKRNAQRYHEAGLRAEWQGHFELAEQNFSRALVNARLGNAPEAGISMATYNLGRLSGYLCKHMESEKLLLEPGLCIRNRSEDEKINEIKRWRKMIIVSHSHSMVIKNYRASA